MKRHTLVRWTAVLVLLLVACSPTGYPEPSAQQTVELTPTPCALEPVVAPTPPAETPGYTELDPATGLHVTGNAPTIDVDSYRLIVTGTVDAPLSLSYDDLRCMRKVEIECTLVCPGFFEDVSTWAGVPMADILDMAGAPRDAAGLRLISADGYGTLVTPDMVWEQESLIAYEWEGEPLPVLHGFPVRAVFPQSAGSSWAKWLVSIQALAETGRAVPPGENPSDEDSDWLFR